MSDSPDFLPERRGQARPRPIPRKRPVPAEDNKRLTAAPDPASSAAPAELSSSSAPPFQPDPHSPLPLIEQWLAQQGWQPFPFQRAVWQAIAEGRSGLLHATTGAGKTYAVWLGLLQALFQHPQPAMGLQVLWITPMRALAADTQRALQQPLQALAPQATLGLRSGDTSSSERSAQNRRLPHALVTTPESLSLLLARADAPVTLGKVQAVVVDEWHELLGNKRGVQTQLALARLQRWNPQLMIWGLSATLGNLEEALSTLIPAAHAPASSTPSGRRRNRSPMPSAHPQPGAATAPIASAAQPVLRAPTPVLVQGQVDKTLRIDTLLPERVERFAWGGHMGLSMLPQVVQCIAESQSTLVFTNTRSQAERWYQALLEHAPAWAGTIALHHGSLDPAVRNWVEIGLKQGQLRAVVCTSSLDLGVDFLPVDRVLQIGSAKGIARLLQRAGRSGHAPGRPSRITLVPTNSMELVEAAAARAAVQAGQIESRHSPHAPMDVLVQHLVTVALGGGFRPDALLDEVRSTRAYHDLSESQWQWALDFVHQGGPSLHAYPDFRRAIPGEDGVWHVPDARLARRHRSNIGTIVSDAAMQVAFVSGTRLGSVEESFIARLRPGDVFMFAGRLLELVRIHDMTAQVKLAAKGSAALPRWNGGRMPLSSTLADAVLEQLQQASDNHYDSPELACARPLLELQQRWSRLPTPQLLLAEILHSREGDHLFLYPFAGRSVHLGLAGLLAWRAGSRRSGTFSLAFNDYGLELLSREPFDWQAALPALLALPREAAADRRAGRRPLLLAEVLASLNATELARRRFREIARIAGLIFQSHPGEQRSQRQLQASASLYYDVFARHDPANQLLQQAREELLQNELDVDLLAATLDRMQGQHLAITPVEHATPLAFPLMVERFREQLSTENLSQRIARIVAELERSAEPTNGSMATADVSATPEQVRHALDLEGRNDVPTGRRSRVRRRS